MNSGLEGQNKVLTCLAVDYKTTVIRGEEELCFSHSCLMYDL